MSNISSAILAWSDTSNFLYSLYTNQKSYPNINRWLKHLYWEVPGFKETTDFTHIKRHYMTSHPFVSTFHDFKIDFRSTLTALCVLDQYLIFNRCDSRQDIFVKGRNIYQSMFLLH